MEKTLWTRRLSTKLTLIALLLLGASVVVGGANIWAFQQLEHDTVLEILGCGRAGGDACRQLGRAHLGRLHHLQYLFVALSLTACGLVIWLAATVHKRAKALTEYSERLARGEGVQPTFPRGGDEFSAVGRSIGSTVTELTRQHVAERDVLDERIETLVSMNKALSGRSSESTLAVSGEAVSGHSLPPAITSSGRFAVAPPHEPVQLGHILLVDDEPEVLRGFARVLKARGHQVTTASRGTEAMAKLSAGHFDALVSDIAMPDMDGIQLLREVRRRDLLIPVILATGQPALKTAAAAVEMGAFQYLIKPISKDSLCQVVEHAVRIHHMALAKQEASELLGQNAALGGDRAGLEASFDRTLETLWMAYQPIVDVRTRTLYAYESLLRSNEPALPHPGAVLDAAERLDRLDILGRTIRSKAALEVAKAPEVPRLFVNLHVRDLLDPDLVNPEAPLSKIAQRVVLEITERSSLEDVRDARKRVAALREMGFRIAVDDMGAGYAGLSSFALLEPEVVKLDMSLIRDVHKNATKRKVVRSMTELSKGMGIEVVAEGIETADERDTLIELGCDLLQGYLFAKPGKPFPKVDWGDLGALSANAPRSRASAG
jgi:EAL domain-containing protein (putative c-di-GMP-specific phosphodiesterase class I)/heme exporter protein D